MMLFFKKVVRFVGIEWLIGLMTGAYIQYLIPSKSFGGFIVSMSCGLLGVVCIGILWMAVGAVTMFGK